MAAEFSWTPPLVVLALGAVTGAVVVAIRSRRKPGDPRTEPSPHVSHAADLQAKYDGLIRRLAEGPPPAEKAAIELEAAQVLMAMESPGVEPPSSHAPATVATTPRPATPRPPASALTGFMYGALAMVTLGGLIYLASLGSSVRTEGGSPTGGFPMASMPSGSAPAPGTAEQDASLVALEEAVRKTPTDIGQRIELVREYLRRRDLMKVFDQTQAVLEIEPGQPHALTYQALVRVAMGQADQAETMLIEAIGKNPRIEDAYIHLAIARLQLGNRKGAEQAIADGQEQFPEDRELLANVFAQISSAENQAGASEATDDHEGHDHPEVASTTPAQGQPSTDGPSAVVVIDLPRGMTVPAGAILFVIVREAGFDSGPPIAVKRVQAINFPITVTLSEKDSMAGESLPGLIRIEARVDRDGDPMTKDPRDPVGIEDNVRPGSGQTLLVLSPAQ